MIVQKVFGIGLPKTGTTSLHVALQELGFDSIHFPVSNQEIAAHDAAVNLSVSSQFERLDNLFPGSKFILTIRELSSWLRSCERQYSSDPASSSVEDKLDSDVLEFFLRLREKSYGKRYYDRDQFEQSYRAHIDHVLEYFVARPGDLLVLDLSAGEGWQKICTFLSKLTPDRPFIHANHEQKLVPKLNDDIIARLKLTPPHSWIR